MTAAKRAFGQNTDLVLALLAERPMSARQLRQATGLAPNIISSIIARLRTATAWNPQRAHIGGWIRHEDVRNRSPMPVYAIGPGKDAKKPAPVDRKLTNREYWARRKQRLEQFAPGADLQAAWNNRAQ